MAPKKMPRVEPYEHKLVAVVHWRFECEECTSGACLTLAKDVPPPEEIDCVGCGGSLELIDDTGIMGISPMTEVGNIVIYDNCPDLEEDATVEVDIAAPSSPTPSSASSSSSTSLRVV